MSKRARAWTPAFPSRMNKRPRRVRDAAEALNPFAGLAVIAGSGRRPGVAGRHGTCDLPLLPPHKAKMKANAWAGTSLRPRKFLHPLVGVAYGPRNTCAVDTFLTLMQHALTSKERRLLMELAPASTSSATSASSCCCSSSSCASCTSRVSAHAASPNPMTALRAALKVLRQGKSSEVAKRKWFRYLCRPVEADDDDDDVVVVGVRSREGATAPGSSKARRNSSSRSSARSSADAGPSVDTQRVTMNRHAKPGAGPPVDPPAQPECIECRCFCSCPNCLSGLCVKCPRCPCKTPCLMGHCFGVMEQFFAHLLPNSVSESPFHFRTLAVWQCADCDYTYRASTHTAHLPLLLQAADVAALLRNGVAAEVSRRDHTPASPRTPQARYQAHAHRMHAAGACQRLGVP